MGRSGHTIAASGSLEVPIESTPLCECMGYDVRSTLVDLYVCLWFEAYLLLAQRLMLVLRQVEHMHLDRANTHTHTNSLVNKSR
jgi:hypothetical protein